MRRPWTLRRRLVLGIVALFAAVSVVIGGVSVLALRSSLVQKLDAQLTSATDLTEQGLGQPPQNSGPGRPGAGELVQFAGPPGTVIATTINGAALGFVRGERFAESVDLSSAQSEALLAAREEPTTIDVPDLGQYRVVTVETDDGTFAVGLSLEEANATATQTALVILGVTLLGILIALLAGLWVVRVALRPLERVTATASHVSELPLERGGVELETRVPESDADPRTEVGQVGSAINRMLDHIGNALALRDASEGKLRSFVADASHELRTPLASIRGYAELTRRSGHELPDDVVRSMGRIESESIRMTSLVEDLLLLARLDDGRELEKRPVDLTGLLADAVSDAFAAGQDHHWELDLPEEPVAVVGDAPRLHQIVVNLLANARVHTPPATRVVTALRTEGNRAIVTVTDDGPGIDPAVLPTVFERFARGDSSRSRAAGSTGLGLAIVQAVVDAHGGEVAVTSEPGRTAFSVRLPLAASA
jgi:two-component system OmpR family sensor kinase